MLSIKLADYVIYIQNINNTTEWHNTIGLYQENGCFMYTLDEYCIQHNWIKLCINWQMMDTINQSLRINLVFKELTCQRYRIQMNKTEYTRNEIEYLILKVFDILCYINCKQIDVNNNIYIYNWQNDNTIISKVFLHGENSTNNAVNTHDNDTNDTAANTHDNDTNDTAVNTHDNDNNDTAVNRDLKTRDDINIELNVKKQLYNGERINLSLQEQYKDNNDKILIGRNISNTQQKQQQYIIDNQLELETEQKHQKIQIRICYQVPKQQWYQNEINWCFKDKVNRYKQYSSVQQIEILQIKFNKYIQLNTIVQPPILYPKNYSKEIQNTLQQQNESRLQRYSVQRMCVAWQIIQYNRSNVVYTTTTTSNDTNNSNIDIKTDDTKTIVDVNISDIKSAVDKNINNNNSTIDKYTNIIEKRVRQYIPEPTQQQSIYKQEINLLINKKLNICDTIQIQQYRQYRQLSNSWNQKINKLIPLEYISINNDNSNNISIMTSIQIINLQNEYNMQSQTKIDKNILKWCQYRIIIENTTNDPNKTLYIRGYGIREYLCKIWSNNIYKDWNWELWWQLKKIDTDNIEEILNYLSTIDDDNTIVVKLNILIERYNSKNNEIVVLDKINIWKDWKERYKNINENTIQYDEIMIYEPKKVWEQCCLYSSEKEDIEQLEILQLQQQQFIGNWKDITIQYQRYIWWWEHVLKSREEQRKIWQSIFREIWQNFQYNNNTNKKVSYIASKYWIKSQKEQYYIDYIWYNFKQCKFWDTDIYINDMQNILDEKFFLNILFKKENKYIQDWNKIFLWCYNNLNKDIIINIIKKQLLNNTKNTLQLQICTIDINEQKQYSFDSGIYIVDYILKEILKNIEYIEYITIEKIQPWFRVYWYEYSILLKGDNNAVNTYNTITANNAVNTYNTITTNNAVNIYNNVINDINENITVNSKKYKKDNSYDKNIQNKFLKYILLKWDTINPLNIKYENEQQRLYILQITGENEWLKVCKTLCNTIINEYKELPKIGIQNALKQFNYNNYNLPIEYFELLLYKQWENILNNNSNIDKLYTRYIICVELQKRYKYKINDNNSDIKCKELGDTLLEKRLWNIYINNFIPINIKDNYIKQDKDIWYIQQEWSDNNIEWTNEYLIWQYNMIDTQDDIELDIELNNSIWEWQTIGQKRSIKNTKIYDNFWKFITKQRKNNRQCKWQYDIDYMQENTYCYTLINQQKKLIEDNIQNREMRWKLCSSQGYRLDKNQKSITSDTTIYINDINDKIKKQQIVQLKNTIEFGKNIEQYYQIELFHWKPSDGLLTTTTSDTTNINNFILNNNNNILQFKCYICEQIRESKQPSQQHDILNNIELFNKIILNTSSKNKIYRRLSWNILSIWYTDINSRYNKNFNIEQIELNERQKEEINNKKDSNNILKSLLIAKNYKITKNQIPNLLQQQEILRGYNCILLKKYINNTNNKIISPKQPQLISIIQICLNRRQFTILNRKQKYKKEYEEYSNICKTLCDPIQQKCNNIKKQQRWQCGIDDTSIILWKDSQIQDIFDLLSQYKEGDSNQCKLWIYENDSLKYLWNRWFVDQISIKDVSTGTISNDDSITVNTNNNTVDTNITVITNTTVDRINNNKNDKKQELQYKQCEGCIKQKKVYRYKQLKVWGSIGILHQQDEQYNINKNKNKNIVYIYNCLERYQNCLIKTSIYNEYIYDIERQVWKWQCNYIMDTVLLSSYTELLQQEHQSILFIIIKRCYNTKDNVILKNTQYSKPWQEIQRITCITKILNKVQRYAKKDILAIIQKGQIQYVYKILCICISDSKKINQQIDITYALIILSCIGQFYDIKTINLQRDCLHTISINSTNVTHNKDWYTITKLNLYQLFSCLQSYKYSKGIIDYNDIVYDDNQVINITQITDRYGTI